MFDNRSVRDKSDPQGRARSHGASSKDGIDPIAGRALLPNGEEVSCTAVMRSPLRGDISLKGKVSPGQVVVCSLDNVGILVGKVNEITPRGILVDFMVRESRREKLAARLDWHAAHAVRTAQLRRAPRIVPLHPAVEIRLAETVTFNGTILDISLSGAAIVLRPNPGLFVGTLLRVAGRYATVVRAIEDGVAVQFVEPFSTDAFDRWVTP